MARKRKPDVRLLFKLACQYERNLLNKNYLLVGLKHDEVTYIETRFLDYHFKHLTGVEVLDSGMSSTLFFKKCVNKRLSTDELAYDVKGLAAVKMEAAQSMFVHDLAARSFGVGNGARMLINADEYAGHQWACMGFRQAGSRWLDPVTMLRSPVKEEVLPADLFPVVAVLSKKIVEPSYESFERSPRDCAIWDMVRMHIDFPLLAFE